MTSSSFTKYSGQQDEVLLNNDYLYYKNKQDFQPIKIEIVPFPDQRKSCFGYTQVSRKMVKQLTPYIYKLSVINASNYPSFAYPLFTLKDDSILQKL
jgi:hypothetical protein